MKLLRSLLVSATCLSLAVSPALAQQGNIVGAAKITNTAQAPGTVTALGTRNEVGKGVQCTFHLTSEVGNPSTVISVEVEDDTSKAWQTLASSSAVTAPGGTATVQVYPGAVATSVPSGLVVAGLKVGAIWRVKQVVTGGTSITGTTSCDLYI